MEQVTQKDCKTSVLGGVSETQLDKTVAELILLHIGGWSRDLQRIRWWICEHPADQDHVYLTCSSLAHMQKP